MTKKTKPRKTRIDAMPDKDIADALIACHGKQQVAADKLGIAGATLSVRINRSLYLTQIREQCEERRLDRAELTIDRLAEEGNLGAACFLLKTKGKHRGYQENAPIIISTEVVNQMAAMTLEIKQAQEERKIANKSTLK